MESDFNKNNAHFTSKLEQRIVFFFVTVGAISITYGVLFIVDFLPEQKTDGAVEEQVQIAETEAVVEALVVVEEKNTDPLPLSIVFDTLGGKEVKILNPESSTVEALDSALLSGVIRHPDSADFKNSGTIFLLGHSSYLPVVRNKNFQAFNGIQKLKWGDTIRLQSSNTEYVYSVERVYEAKATDAEVKIERGDAKLVLATCNSFATKDDRFIVEATLVGKHPIGTPAV
jgi:LPXTG-site transpeptidase (sortase) family protein